MAACVHGGRHPPHPRLVQRRQLRRPLRLDQRQDQQPHRRIRLDYFVCDKITELPNVQGFHGIFPDKRDPVDPAINYTTRVFCGGRVRHSAAQQRHRRHKQKYRSLFTCVDAETMEVRWQVLIDGNCDLVATSYDGKLAATNQYNTEMGATTKT
jgi:nitrous-oxide reductase